MKKILLVYARLPDPVHNHTVSKVKQFLKSTCIDHCIMERSTLRIPHCKGFDLVVVVGGDGTFLRAANSIRDKTPLFGINSNPSKKEGFFMQATKDDFQKKWQKIMQREFTLQKLSRLYGIRNGKKLSDLALNEFYIGYRDTTLVAHYELSLRGKKEIQRSSGVLIGTASGSHGWIKSAGGTVLAKTSKKFQMVVREPINARTSKATVAQVILKPSQTISFTSFMHEGVIIVDGQRKNILFRKGDTLAIGVSKHPLYVYSFQEK